MTVLSTRSVVGARSVAVERTPQRLDPLGAQSAWLLVPLLGTVAVGYAVFSSIRHAGQFRDLGLDILAIGVLLLAVIVASIRSHPGFAPFGRWSHFSIIAVALTAACLSTASLWGHNERIQDDWGQIAVALLLVAMPLYRPIGEVAGSAVVSAVVLGGLAAAQHSLVISNSPLVYATVAATPILALAAGGAGYAWTMTGETLHWREPAREGQARLDGELRQAAERMIAQERMTALNAEAVPFLTDLLRRQDIAATDVERARVLADRLRSMSVRAVGRTWLADTLSLALGSRLAAIGRARDEHPTPADRVDDPDHLERVLTSDQRAIVGALIATVSGLPGLDPDSLRISASTPDRPTFLLSAQVDEPRAELRRELLPFVSALNATAMDATMRVRGTELKVRFASPGGFPYSDGRRR
ncbi:hypothetical protein [Leifsonia sp. NPDC077715]|uniref:hypothetical protein n=1 Tax=Leifsonia sp. NPDC077715 TaxID=3155539 RepID=UPI00341426F4